jgi:hypothetical protein
VIAQPAGIHRVPEQLVEFFGRRQIGIAQAEIKNVFGAVFGLQLRPLFEHFADKRRPGNDILYFIRYGHPDNSTQISRQDAAPTVDNEKWDPAERENNRFNLLIISGLQTLSTCNR